MIREFVQLHNEPEKKFNRCPVIPTLIEHSVRRSDTPTQLLTLKDMDLENFKSHQQSLSQSPTEFELRISRGDFPPCVDERPRSARHSRLHVACGREPQYVPPSTVGRPAARATLSRGPFRCQPPTSKCGGCGSCSYCGSHGTNRCQRISVDGRTFFFRGMVGSLVRFV